MFTALSRRTVATALAAAQLIAVAHLALVPHTTSLSGGVVSSGHAIEEHFDAIAHHGAHAHAPAPQTAASGEEHCAVLALLGASSAPRVEARALTAPVASQTAEAPSASPFAPTRLERLLAAPKASPPHQPLS